MLLRTYKPNQYSFSSLVLLISPPHFPPYITFDICDIWETTYSPPVFLLQRGAAVLRRSLVVLAGAAFLARGGATERLTAWAERTRSSANKRRTPQMDRSRAKATTDTRRLHLLCALELFYVVLFLSGRYWYRNNYYLTLSYNSVSGFSVFPPKCSMFFSSQRSLAVNICRTVLHTLKLAVR